MGEEEFCFSCRDEHHFQNVDAVFPLYTYRLWRKNLLFEWKINSQRSLSSLFAKAVDTALRMLYPDRSVPPVVPVPPRPGKIRTAGWDQVDELCRYLHSCYGYTVLHLLQRFSREQQKKKTLEQRLESKSSYGLLHEKPLKNKTVPEEVVLLDDIVTTGATVNACAEVLHNVGIRKVQVLSLFIVD